MLPSKYIHLILAILALASPAHGGISWGTFLGADWKAQEGNIHNTLYFKSKYHDNMHIAVLINTLDSFLPCDVNNK